MSTTTRSHTLSVYDLSTYNVGQPAAPQFTTLCPGTYRPGDPVEFIDPLTGAFGPADVVRRGVVSGVDLVAGVVSVDLEPRSLNPDRS